MNEKTARRAPFSRDFERRKEPRFQVELNGIVLRESPTGTKSALKMKVENLSAHGAGVVCENRIPVGEKLEITISDAMQFKCKVVRVTRTPDDHFRLGVVLEREFSDVAGSAQSETPNGESKGPELRLWETTSINELAFTRDYRLNRLLHFVEQHYDEPIPLTEAAQVAALEVTYFSAFFHEKVGITYSSWLQRLRVAKAIALLEDECLSITEIAFQVGFNDLRTFQRSVKKHTKLTPSALRKKLCEAATPDPHLDAHS